jgi:hypothetical protein
MFALSPSVRRPAFVIVSFVGLSLPALALADKTAPTDAVKVGETAPLRVAVLPC